MHMQPLHVFLVSLVALALTCDGKIHHVELQSDARTVYSFEKFGFANGGVLNATVHNLNVVTVVDGKDSQEFPVDSKIGFLLAKIDNLEQFETEVEDQVCVFDVKEVVKSLNIATQPNNKEINFLFNVDASGEGLYHFYFASCIPLPIKVTFTMDAYLYNPGPVYLSTGDSGVPTILFLFVVLFFVAQLQWVRYLRSHSSDVSRVHNMMTVLGALKILSLASEGLDKHYVKVTGYSMGWNVAYYIFTFMKGISLFTVILLIGAGWSVLKPSLDPRERRILLVVITLQVIDNIALVVEEELAPGSRGWMQWRDILHVVDLICCLAVFLPIMWQIKHLRTGARSDGRVERNLKKLQQFKKFYFAVVGYIYFTRVIVYLLSATLPYHQSWVKVASREAATLLFYAVTAYSFRPGSENMYAKVPTQLPDDDYEDEDDDENLNEFGLPSNGVEMT